MRVLPTLLLSGMMLSAAPAALAQDAARAAVRVFDAGELTLDRYEVIERLWTGTWRASFWVPTHDDASSAIASLTSKAADLGADGVVNLHCVNDAGGWASGYYCYGLAIKLR
jgi:uncharacterized protein YbjQ (UPF0145 family)